jgi:hypothetical protein
MYTRSASRYTRTAFLRRRELRDTGLAGSAGGRLRKARPIGIPRSSADLMSALSEVRYPRVRATSVDAFGGILP